MKNLKEREEVIKYSIKLNTDNLSPSKIRKYFIKRFEDDIEGFFITPSGKKYETLKPEDIVFLSLMKKKIFYHGLIQEKIPHQNGDFIKIFIRIDGKQKLLFMLIQLMPTAVSLIGNPSLLFIT